LLSKLRELFKTHNGILENRARVLSAATCRRADREFAMTCAYAKAKDASIPDKQSF